MRTWLFVLSLGVMIAFWNGIAGFANSPRWFVLCLVPLALFWCGRVEMKAAHWAAFALLAYGAVSVTWSLVPLDALDWLMKFALVGAAFWLGSSALDLQPAYTGFAIGVAVSAALSIAQYLGWQPVDSLAGPGGLFGNKNFMGEAAALAIIGVVGGPRWYLAIGPMVALFLASCSEAWLALGAAFLVAFGLQSGKVKLTLECGVMIVGGVTLISIDHYGDLQTRFAIWQDTIAGLTWLGRGLGNFMAAFPAHATHLDLLQQRPEFAHNDFLQLAFELGLPGAAAFGAVGILAFTVQGHVRERAVLGAIVVEAMFGFPLHMPATGFMGALVAGYVCRDGPYLRTVLVSGRAAWARGVAMARSASARQHGLSS
jgi:hypothetical protein